MAFASSPTSFAKSAASIAEPHPRPPRRLSLRANFLWTLGGNVLNVVCQWGLLAILARTVADEVTGQYVLAISLCAPVFMFAGLDLRTLQATDSQQQFRFREYLAVRIAASLVAFAGIPLVLLLTDTSQAAIQVIIGVAAGRLCDSISDVMYGLMQKCERLDRVSQSVFLRSLLSSLALAGIVLASGDLLLGVWISAVARLGVLLLFDLPVSRSLKNATEASVRLAGSSGVSTADITPRPRPLEMSRLWELACLGFPLSAKVMLVSLSTHIPRLMVAVVGGLAGAGIFGPIAAAGTALSTVARALNQTVSARIGRLAANRDFAGLRRLVGRMQLFYLGVGSAGVLVSAIWGGPLLATAFREDYRQHGLLLTYLVLAVVLQCLSGVTDLTLVALRRVRWLAPVMALNVGVSVVACWLLIPPMGLNGAALAMIVGRVVRLGILNSLLARATRDIVLDSNTQNGEVVDNNTAAFDSLAA